MLIFIERWFSCGNGEVGLYLSDYIPLVHLFPNMYPYHTPDAGLDNLTGMGNIYYETTK